MKKDIRVRFAPSPTGSPHIGNIRTAIYNWFFARKNNGTFVLRIEDTDIKRSTEESEKEIIRDMRWLGLDWDEGPDAGGSYGPYRQSERRDIYQQYAQKLLDEGKAYFCYCTDKELENERLKAKMNNQMPKYSGRCRNLSAEDRKRLEKEGRKPAVRFKVPQNETIMVKDIVRGNVDFDSSNLGDFVLMKSDNTPAYNFAVVVDDALMKISHVIRAEDHLSNTPKQLLLYEALGFPHPKFAHAAMILGQDHSPLSKRHGAASISEYRCKGYLPEAVINYLSLLGWSPKDEKEIFSVKELIDSFEIDNINPSAAVFDINKLNWINSNHIKEKELFELTELALPYLQKTGFVEKNPDEETIDWLTEVIDIARDGLDHLSQLSSEERIDFFFEKGVDFKCEGNAQKIFDEDTLPVFRTVIDKINDSSDLNPETAQNIISSTIKELDVGGRKVYHPLRVALTGKESGPELNHVIHILGRERTVYRLKEAVKRI